MSSPIVDVKNVGKLYGEHRALAGVNFAIAEGETVGLVGPNGAGKTTLLEIMQGIKEFSEGSIALWGEDILRGLNGAKQRVGVSPQSIALPNYLTVREILQMYRTIYDYGFPPENLIERVGLDEKKNVRFGRLSGGQKRRLAIALALIGDPELLILDEPTGDLDPQGRRFIWDLIKHTNRTASRTTVIATHQMDEAEALCERIVIIDKGQIMAMGSPQELIDTHCPGHKVIFEMDVPEQDFALADVKPYEIITKDKHQSVVVETDSMDDSLATIQQLNTHHAESIGNLHIKQNSLEDVFIKLTGRELRD